MIFATNAIPKEFQFMTDAGIYDCGNKQGFLIANLAVGMRDPDTRQVIKALIEKSGW